MRLLYLVLKQIADSQPLSSDDVRMPKAELEQAIHLFAEHGYLTEVYPGMNMDLPPKRLITQKGTAFLTEHGRYASEVPAERQAWPHWVRFQGDVYVPLRHSIPKRPAKRTTGPAYDEWRLCLRRTEQGCVARGGTVQRTVIAEAATERQLTSVERNLGKPIPASFREVLGTFAKQVYFSWHFPDGAGLPLDRSGVCESSGNENVPDFLRRDIGSGGFFDDGLWDLDKLADYESGRLDNADRDYDSLRDHWEHSFLFAKDGAGNYLGIDLLYNPGEIIYLSWDMQMHGWRLGADFATFMDNWMRVGCAGHFGEDFMLFSSEETPYVDHLSANSRRWKAWIGLE